MTNKFQNKYRIPSTRLQNWDYCWAGAYFITICTKNREHYFGEIENGEMRLSEIGHIAEQEWIKTFDMRPDMNIQMGEFVVMPNHFHAIIIIGENEYNQRDDDGDDHRCCRDAMHCVCTTGVCTTDVIITLVFMIIFIFPDNYNGMKMIGHYHKFPHL